MSNTGLPWPNSAGYWSSDGQQYFARASNSNGDYEVRDCRNLDVVSYLNKEAFYNLYRDRQPFPWFPCTLTIHDGRDEMMSAELQQGLQKQIDRDKQMKAITIAYVKTDDVKNFLSKWGLSSFLPAFRKLANKGIEVPIEAVMSAGEKVATELLTKICEHVEAWPVSHAKYLLVTNIGEPDTVPGLKDWWAKHKPKSEREQRLEKIAKVLSLDGKTTVPELLIVAERVLEALDE